MRQAVDLLSFSSFSQEDSTLTLKNVSLTSSVVRTNKVNFDSLYVPEQAHRDNSISGFLLY